MTEEGGRWRLAGAVAAAVGFAAFLLRAPLSRFAHGIWGPENAWTNRDFLGAYWLYWSVGEGGDWIAKTNWPDGGFALQHHIPNPFDAWVLGPLVARLPFPLWWNVLQLGHHLGNVAATVLLARAVGVRPASAAAAGALVAATPAMLHEIAGGRTVSGIAWPGLCALAFLVRGRALPAGLLLGAQALAYAYSGLLFGLAALVLRPRLAARALLVAALPVAPYLLWLSPALSGGWGAPPAGHTSLPVAGVLGLDLVPERFQLHPALLLGLVAAGGRWGAVIAIACLFALGPAVEWTRGSPLFTSPFAWVASIVPGLDRLHHPVRSVLLLAPALAVGLARGLDRLPRWVAVAVPLAAIANQGAMRMAVPWDVDPHPPGQALAESLRGGEGGIVDLTGDHGPALGLQPFHRRPMLEGLRRERPRQDRRAGALRARVDGWERGERQPGLREELLGAGFSAVIVIERAGPVDTRAIEADLGPPETPGVWPLR